MCLQIQQLSGSGAGPTPTPTLNPCSEHEDEYFYALCVQGLLDPPVVDVPGNEHVENPDNNPGFNPLDYSSLSSLGNSQNDEPTPDHPGEPTDNPADNPLDYSDSDSISLY